MKYIGWIDLNARTGAKHEQWECHVFGGNWIVIRPLIGEEPCWFHRTMGRLLLGHRWVKVTL